MCQVQDVGLAQGLTKTHLHQLETVKVGRRLSEKRLYGLHEGTVLDYLLSGQSPPDCLNCSSSLKTG